MALSTINDTSKRAGANSGNTAVTATRPPVVAGNPADLGEPPPADESTFEQGESLAPTSTTPYRAPAVPLGISLAARTSASSYLGRPLPASVTLKGLVRGDIADAARIVSGLSNSGIDTLILSSAGDEDLLFKLVLDMEGLSATLKRSYAPGVQALADAQLTNGAILRTEDGIARLKSGCARIAQKGTDGSEILERISTRKRTEDLRSEIERAQQSGRFDRASAQGLMEDIRRNFGEELSVRRLADLRAARSLFERDPASATDALIADARSWIVLKSIRDEWSAIPRSDHRYYLEHVREVAKLDAAMRALSLMHRFESDQIAEIASGNMPRADLVRSVRRELCKMEIELKKHAIDAMSGDEDFESDGPVMALTGDAIGAEHAGVQGAWRRDGYDPKKRAFAEAALEGEALDQFIWGVGVTTAIVAASMVTLGAGPILLAACGVSEGVTTAVVAGTGLAIAAAFDAYAIREAGIGIMKANDNLDLARAVLREGDGPMAIRDAKSYFEMSVGFAALAVAMSAVTTVAVAKDIPALMSGLRSAKKGAPPPSSPQPPPSQTPGGGGIRKAFEEDGFDVPASIDVKGAAENSSPGVVPTAADTSDATPWFSKPGLTADERGALFSAQAQRAKMDRGRPPPAAEMRSDVDDVPQGLRRSDEGVKKPVLRADEEKQPTGSQSSAAVGESSAQTITIADGETILLVDEINEAVPVSELRVKVSEKLSPERRSELIAEVKRDCGKKLESSRVQLLDRDGEVFFDSNPLDKTVVVKMESGVEMTVGSDLSPQVARVREFAADAVSKGRQFILKDGSGKTLLSVDGRARSLAANIGSDHARPQMLKIIDDLLKRSTDFDWSIKLESPNAITSTAAEEMKPLITELARRDSKIMRIEEVNGGKRVVYVRDGALRFKINGPSTEVSRMAMVERNATLLSEKTGRPIDESRAFFRSAMSHAAAKKGLEPQLDLFYGRDGWGQRWDDVMSRMLDYNGSVRLDRLLDLVEALSKGVDLEAAVAAENNMSFVQIFADSPLKSKYIAALRDDLNPRGGVELKGPFISTFYKAMVKGDGPTTLELQWLRRIRDRLRPGDQIHVIKTSNHGGTGSTPEFKIVREGAPTDFVEVKQCSKGNSAVQDELLIDKDGNAIEGESIDPELLGQNMYDGAFEGKSGDKKALSGQTGRAIHQLTNRSDAITAEAVGEQIAIVSVDSDLSASNLELMAEGVKRGLVKIVARNRNAKIGVIIDMPSNVVMVKYVGGKPIVEIISKQGQSWEAQLLARVE